MTRVDYVDGVAYADGGNRGTPGPSACAAILYVGNKEMSDTRFLGVGTNNEAEYNGLLLALEMAKEYSVTHLKIRLDSKVIVEQVLGNYWCREPRLQPLHEQANKLAAEFAQVEIIHVHRGQNRVADALCTELLDSLCGKRRG